VRLSWSLQEENLCSESFNFLWSALAYRRLTTRDQRIDLAPILYQEFIKPNGAQVVNIDSKTRQIVKDAFESEDYSPDMFVPATKMVFAMCDSDIFRRFVLSHQYKAMLQDPVSIESLALRNYHRRRHSFSIVPMEEEYLMVTDRTAHLQHPRHSCAHGASHRVDPLTDLCAYLRNVPFVSCCLGRLPPLFFVVICYLVLFGFVRLCPLDVCS
jgi:hypothetical protein